MGGNIPAGTHAIGIMLVQTKGETLVTQSRWKSKVMWASIAAILLTLFGKLGLYQAIGITQEPLQNVIDALLALLVAFGVLNNPTDPEHF